VLLEAAAHGTELRAEPAGGAPCLVLADADLDRAAAAALFGAFALGGQRRTATSAVLVQRPVYEQFVGLLADRASRIRVGPPADADTQLGPLADPGHYEALAAGVRLGVREGARLAAGRRPTCGPRTWSGRAGWRRPSTRRAPG
jgi:5-carboxymethyl-2-hydroxymuconic-semialdehyde dehydrogenase